MIRRIGWVVVRNLHAARPQGEHRVMEKMKPGEQVENSPPAKTIWGVGSSKVAEIARKLFPSSTSPQVKTPKKRRPSEDEASDIGLLTEGERTDMVDKVIEKR